MFEKKLKVFLFRVDVKNELALYVGVMFKIIQILYFKLIRSPKINIFLLF